MHIHSPTSCKVILGKMHNSVFDLGRYVHQSLLLLDLCIAAKALALLRLRTRELGMQLLESLLAEGIKRGGIFEGGNEVILVVGVGSRGIEHRGYVRIEVRHLRQRDNVADGK